MAKVYADLIMKGRKKLPDVPDNLRQEVIEILTEHGWVGDD